MSKIMTNNEVCRALFGKSEKQCKMEMMEYFFGSFTGSAREMLIKDSATKEEAEELQQIWNCRDKQAKAQGRKVNGPVITPFGTIF